MIHWHIGIDVRTYIFCIPTLAGRIASAEVRNINQVWKTLLKGRMFLTDVGNIYVSKANKRFRPSTTGHKNRWWATFSPFVIYRNFGLAEVDIRHYRLFDQLYGHGSSIPSGRWKRLAFGHLIRLSFVLPLVLSAPPPHKLFRSRRDIFYFCSRPASKRARWNSHFHRIWIDSDVHGIWLNLTNYLGVWGGVIGPERTTGQCHWGGSLQRLLLIAPSQLWD